MKNGFIYLWFDRQRKMFYIGSHLGSKDDPYLSSSRWLNAEIKYRPSDFKRKILKFLPKDKLQKEEYRLIKLIKEHEFGKKYYNIKSGQKRGSEPWNKGKTGIYSDESKLKMSKAKIGKRAHNKGKPNPSAAENGKRSAAKISHTVTGRKIQTRPDGTRYWVYPK